MVLGGETEHTLRRIVKYGDGWLPRAMKPSMIREGMAKLQRLAEEAGRDPASISVSAFSPPSKQEVIEEYKDMAVERVILWVPPKDENDTLRRLDRYVDWM